MPALADPESVIDWNSEGSNIAGSLDCPTRNYDDDIDEFMSVEEEGEICEGPSLSLSSFLVPETLPASCGKLDHSLTQDFSAMMHLEAQELRHPLFSLEFESL